MAKVKQLILVAALIAASGCATRPREFDARLAKAPADNQAYLRDFATCRLLVRSNFRNNTAQQTAAVAVGSSTMLVGGFIAAKVIRSDREKRLNAQMTECLQKYGYAVSGWDRVGKKRRSNNSEPPAAVAQTAEEPAQ